MRFGVLNMEDSEKQILYVVIEIILAIVVGIVAWQSYGTGYGLLSTGVILFVSMIGNHVLFRKEQEIFYILVLGIASLITTVIGVYQITSGNNFSGLFAIITAIIIVLFMFVLLQRIYGKKNTEKSNSQ